MDTFVRLFLSWIGKFMSWQVKVSVKSLSGISCSIHSRRKTNVGIALALPVLIEWILCFINLPGVVWQLAQSCFLNALRSTGKWTFWKTFERQKYHAKEPKTACHGQLVSVLARVPRQWVAHKTFQRSSKSRQNLRVNRLQHKCQKQHFPPLEEDTCLFSRRNEWTWKQLLTSLMSCHCRAFSSLARWD